MISFLDIVSKFGFVDHACVSVNFPRVYRPILHLLLVVVCCCYIVDASPNQAKVIFLYCCVLLLQFLPILISHSIMQNQSSLDTNTDSSWNVYNVSSGSDSTISKFNGSKDVQFQSQSFTTWASSFSTTGSAKATNGVAVDTNGTSLIISYTHAFLHRNIPMVNSPSFTLTIILSIRKHICYRSVVRV